MKKTFRSRFFSLPFAVLITLVLAHLVVAADKKAARVTQLVRDVRLLVSRTASRPATLNDNVTPGTSVRTGGESRAELTFSDESLTRLGANTVFSFAGSHNYELTSGAVLLAVPAGAGTVHVNTSAVSAGISGGVALAETHKNSWSKFIVIEGQGVIILKKTGERIILLPGQIVMLPPGGKKFTKVQNIDLQKLINKSGLFRFSALPGWLKTLVNTEVAKQKTSPPPGGVVTPDEIDTIDQRAAAEPQHTPPRPTRPPG